LAWKFVPTDDYDLATLIKWKKFFEKDLKYAEDYLAYVKKMHHLWRNSKFPILTIAERDVAVSKYNLLTLNEAIKIAKAKGH